MALFTEMHQDHTMALANVATVTQANRTSVALLTKTIAELSTQVTTLTANLATSQSDSDRLKRSGHRFSNAGAPANHINYSGNVGALSDQSPLYYQNIYSRSGEKSDPMGIAHLTGLRSRKPILPRLAANRLMDTKNWRRGCIIREEKHGTIIGSTADQSIEGGWD